MRQGRSGVIFSTQRLFALALRGGLFDNAEASNKQHTHIQLALQFATAGESAPGQTSSAVVVHRQLIIPVVNSAIAIHHPLAFAAGADADNCHCRRLRYHAIKAVSDPCHEPLPDASRGGVKVLGKNRVCNDQLHYRFWKSWRSYYRANCATFDRWKKKIAAKTLSPRYSTGGSEQAQLTAR